MAPEKCAVWWSARWHDIGPGLRRSIRSKCCVPTSTGNWLIHNLPISPLSNCWLTITVRKRCGMDNHLKKAYSTKKRNETVLTKWIVPRWGDYRPADIKSVAVEEWLDGLVHDHREKNKGKPLANGTKVKIRNLMSAIFRHGMRYEFLPRVEEANPMKYVRQSGKRQGIPAVLEVGQFQQLFAALEQRERTMVLLDCGSGLRRGELIGLNGRHRFRQRSRWMSVPLGGRNGCRRMSKPKRQRRPCLSMTS